MQPSEVTNRPRSAGARLTEGRRPAANVIPQAAPGGSGAYPPLKSLLSFNARLGGCSRLRTKNDHMRDTQLIYASRPFGYDDLTLTSILMQARENNARNGITGAIICREDLFLQILEGPRDLVTSTFSRILRDERHVDIVNLLTGEIDGRLFPKWSMRHDPAQSWMWTPEEVARGVVGRASDQEIRGIFERLAREPDCLSEV